MTISSRGRRRGPRLLLPVLGGALLALTALGCQSRGNVSGKVTYKNKPVVFGTVLIHGRDGLRQGNIEPDGSFTVYGVAVGQARVAVNSPNPKGIELYPNKNPQYNQEPYSDVPGWFAIPKKYEDVTTSGLTYTIKGGVTRSTSSWSSRRTPPRPNPGLRDPPGSRRRKGTFPCPFPAAGKILLQSEGFELFVRTFELRPLTK